MQQKTAHKRRKLPPEVTFPQTGRSCFLRLTCLPNNVGPGRSELLGLRGWPAGSVRAKDSRTQCIQ